MNARIFAFTLALVLMATFASAQTRKISHHSHSGSPATFTMMMGMDNLGRAEPEPIYIVDPYIERVRKYYEQVARRNPQPQVEVKRSAMDSIPAKTIEPNQPANDAPKSEPVKTKRKHKGAEAAVEDIPAPDFLVKSRPQSSSTAITPVSEPTQGNLWLLVGILACTVAPGIFVASSLRQRKSVS